MPSKVMKVGAKANPKNEKIETEIERIPPFATNMFFVRPPTTIKCFSRPNRPDSDCSVVRETNLDTNMYKTSFFDPRNPKNLQNGVAKSTKFTIIQAWIPKMFLCSPVPRDSHMAPQGANMDGKSQELKSGNAFA